jgi:hypothetical protein
MCPRCALLEAENANLRAQLGQKVRADVNGRLREGLGVTMHQAKFLLALYQVRGEIVPFDVLLDVLPMRYTKSADGRRSEHYLRVLAYQTRRAVGPGVVATTRAAFDRVAGGYSLTPHGLDVVAGALAGQFMWRAAA